MSASRSRLADSPSPLAQIFSRRLRLAQEEADIKNEPLARELDVSVRLVQKWRAGASLPSEGNLVRIAHVFGRPIAWFFEDVGEAVVA